MPRLTGETSFYSTPVICDSRGHFVAASRAYRIYVSNDIHGSRDGAFDGVKLENRHLYVGFLVLVIVKTS